MNISIPDEITNIMEVVKSAGFEIYIIGGFVRDMIIGVPSKDVDLFTNATGDEIKTLFPNSKVIGGDISFHQHEKSGSIIIHDIMTRLKFSSADIKYAETIIAEHMVGYDDEMSDRVFIRRFSNLENGGVTVEDYMIMRYCDYQGNTKNPRVKFGDYLNTDGLHVRYYDLKFSGVPFGVKDLMISGHDIMDMGFPAGPEIGAILNDVFTQVVDGNIENARHTLMVYVKMKYM
jgi:hypothetical protein